MDTLVRKAKKGDTEAFISLIEDNKAILKRIALGYLANEEDAADALQDTILDAFVHISTLRAEKYFKTWLVRILLNHCTKIYHKNKKYASLENIGDIGLDDRQVARVEFLQLLHSLPEKNRTIFQLYYGEGFTIKEIAKILKIKENTVKSRLHRGREQLKAQLQ